MPMTDRAWMEKAECRNGYDEDDWFQNEPPGRSTSDNVATARARAVCKRCPVVAECGAYAAALGPSLEGMWGGLTRGERERARRRGWRPEMVVQPPRPVSEMDRAWQIIRAVADEHKVSVDELVGHGRERWVVGPRHAAMVAVRAQTGLSLPQIGRLFGGRHHTTVMDAIRSVRVPS